MTKEGTNMGKKVKINGKWPLVLPDSSADEWIGNMKFHNNSWEMPRLLALEKIIKDRKAHGKKTVVMYIGAYKGDMAALLASWGADLILMESTAAFWTLIEETWKLNKLPKPVGFWSGLVSNQTVFSGILPALDKWPTRKAEYVEGHVGFSHLAESGQDVENYPQITIDEFINTTGIVPDIITMDVEGSELPVMQGGIQNLVKTNAQYMMSLHPEFGYHNHGYYVRELFDLFADNGYKWDYLDFDHEFHYLFYRNKAV